MTEEEKKYVVQIQSRINEVLASFGFEKLKRANPDTDKLVRSCFYPLGLDIAVEHMKKQKSQKNVWTLQFEGGGLGLPHDDFESIAGHHSNLCQMPNISSGRVSKWKISGLSEEEFLAKLTELVKAYVAWGKEGRRSLESENPDFSEPAPLEKDYPENSNYLENQMLETEIQRLAKQRVCQSQLRQRLLASRHVCELTGIRTSNLLIASHIKPWKDASDAERVDLDNVLLLSAHMDKLFDQGYISFDDEGKILISPELPEEDRRILGVHEEMKLSGKPSSKMRGYLQSHRQLHKFE